MQKQAKIATPPAGLAPRQPAKEPPQPRPAGAMPTTRKMTTGLVGRAVLCPPPVANRRVLVYHDSDLLRCLAESGIKVIEDRDQAGLYHTLLKCRKA